MSCSNEAALDFPCFVRQRSAQNVNIRRSINPTDDSAEVGKSA